MTQGVKGGKKCLEICAIKEGGPTPNGKCHFKLFSEPFPSVPCVFYTISQVWAMCIVSDD